MGIGAISFFALVAETDSDEPLSRRFIGRIACPSGRFSDLLVGSGYDELCALLLQFNLQQQASGAQQVSICTDTHYTGFAYFVSALCKELKHQLDPSVAGISGFTPYSIILGTEILSLYRKLHSPSVTDVKVSAPGVDGTPCAECLIWKLETIAREMGIRGMGRLHQTYFKKQDFPIITTFADSTHTPRVITSEQELAGVCRMASVNLGHMSKRAAADRLEQSAVPSLQQLATVVCSMQRDTARNPRRDGRIIVIE